MTTNPNFTTTQVELHDYVAGLHGYKVRLHDYKAELHIRVPNLKVKTGGCPL